MEERQSLLNQIEGTIRMANKSIRETTFAYLASCVPSEVLKPIRTVVLTGVGDDYFAAMAARPLFENTESGTPCGCVAETQEALYFSRYRNRYEDGWHPVLTKSTLLVAISTSGSDSMTVEALRRLNEKGGKTVAVTNDIYGPVAAAAQYVVDMNACGLNPENKLSAFTAAALCAMMFGMHFSVVKGRLPARCALAQQEAMAGYVNAFSGKTMTGLKEIAAAIASEWKKIGVEYVDVVADGYEFPAAQVGAARVIDSRAAMAMVDDNEDWNHIPFWTRNPDRVGTVLFANSGSTSFGRSVENADTFTALGRKLVVITDAETDVFPESAAVVVLPKSQYRWAVPLMCHLPLSLIAADMTMTGGY